jgi:CRP-like cAMP-binding protein
LAKRVTRAVQIVDGEIIEQQLAKTFPVLTQAQLVAITHNVDPEKYQPGQDILRRGEPVEQFCVIVKGIVEILVPDVAGKDKVVATMRDGDYFGEIEMMQGGTSRATARAAGESIVEVLRFDRHAFNEMVAQSPELKASIARVVQQREAENIAARGGAS